MDRFVPHLRRVCLLPAVLSLLLVVVPRPVARAALPNIYEEPAGDPGDGVLRPAGHGADTAITPAGRGTVTVTTLNPQSPPPSTATRPPFATCLRLVPVLPPPGQPWLLSFRLIRCDLATADAGTEPSVGIYRGGRWHRAF
jgi:hypothetical protein